jgi:hypothetical protein
VICRSFPQDVSLFIEVKRRIHNDRIHIRRDQEVTVKLLLFAGAYFPLIALISMIAFGDDRPVKLKPAPVKCAFVFTETIGQPLINASCR